MLSKCPPKKDIFKEFRRVIRVRFVNFPNTIISEQFFVSNNFVSEGNFFLLGVFPWESLHKTLITHFLAFSSRNLIAIKLP